MTIDERWEFLRKSSKIVLRAFLNGQNPTEEQLHKLKCAIDSVELERVCGHRYVDGECDCQAEPGPVVYVG